MTPHAPSAAALPSQPFFHTDEQRRALARQRFFDEGQRPTGLVPDGVIQSWTRCLQARREAAEPVRPGAVSALRLQSALRRHRLLLAAAAPELAHLQALTAGRRCHAMLIDPDGIVLQAQGAAAEAGAGLLPAVSQPGLDVSERAFGTTAPAVVLRSGQACAVQGAEHFFFGLQALRCAAAPVHDAAGGIAGVLNLSVEGDGFGFDALAVAATYAAAIAHRLARERQRDGWLLRFHVHPDWVDTPAAALAGLDDGGRVRWCNDAAARWLPDGLADLQAWLGPEAPDRPGDAPRCGTLPHGLPVWWRLQRAAPAAAPAPVPAPPPVVAVAPLADQRRAAIVQALQACGGNVSRAARLLGISRGAVYRQAARDGQASEELFRS